MADAGIVPLLNSSHLLYRPENITNVMVNTVYYGMYDYLNIGLS